jgi:hypothetical protein
MAGPLYGLYRSWREGAIYGLITGATIFAGMMLGL